MQDDKKLLVVDFDNTLFDWVGLWHACFSAMMKQVSETSGVPFEAMRDDIRAIHQEHRTSEYAFLLESIPSLKPALKGGSAAKVFETAIKAFREARKERLRLYVRRRSRPRLR